MKTVLKETLKAVGWMFAGAVLLVFGWLAYAQLILLPRFEDERISEFRRPVFAADDGDQKSDRPPIQRRHYSWRVLSHVYTPDASPARPQDHALARGGWSPGDPRPSPEHAVTGHRVVAGPGAMLNYQRYSDDVEPPAMTDRAVFEKLTIFLAQDPSGDYGRLLLSEHPGIIVFWSRGSPDLDRGQFCAGYATSGEIEYRRVAGEFEAKLSFEIDASGEAQPDGSACEPFEFRHASEFWLTRVEQLGQWQGGGWGRASIMECMPDR